MAIFSANHKTIGRSTHAAGTAGAHARYITRAGAASLVMGEHMPTDRDAARAWLDEREAGDRKNGRVCDKVLLALPVEMDSVQRADLVREFMQAFGGGRVSWLAGVHDRGADAHNPHVHILIRDKDHETGARVFGTSEKGSTERIRELWEMVVNQALERAGIEARIDRRSLEEQGIAREAGIHIGPNVLAMEERGLRPVSMAQDIERGGEVVRVVNWPEIDQGRTRADRQREIEAGNVEREQEHDRDKGDKTAAHLPPAAGNAERRAAEWAEQEADACGTQQPEPAPLPVLAIGVSGRAVAWPLVSLNLPAAPPRAERELVRTRGSDRLDPQATVPAREKIAPVSEDRGAISGGTIAGNRNAESGRLVSLVAAARAKLTHLVDRLEAAFSAIRGRDANQYPNTARAPKPAFACKVGGGAWPWGTVQQAEQSPIQEVRKTGQDDFQKPPAVVQGREEAVEAERQRIREDLERGRKVLREILPPRGGHGQNSPER